MTKHCPDFSVERMRRAVAACRFGRLSPAAIAHLAVRQKKYHVTQTTKPNRD